MTSLPQVAPARKQIDAAGERELLIHHLRTAVARSRLITNLLETVGVSLRHRQISTEEAMRWLHDEGVLDWIELGPAPPQLARAANG
jgi:hypothetical protein